MSRRKNHEPIGETAQEQQECDTETEARTEAPAEDRSEGDPKPTLVSVEEFCERVESEREARRAAAPCTGVACPQCGCEFFYNSPLGAGTLPTRKATCRGCQFSTALPNDSPNAD